MRRREFITLLGSAATMPSAWPLVARAQQRERIRRVGMLVAGTADDPQTQVRNAAFLQGLQQYGWTVGQNIQIDIRWTQGNAEITRKHAGELAALAPDVIVVGGSASVTPLLQVTRKVPIVFVIVPDPVGAGFVDSLARPGGNATGFMSFEPGISAKFLQMLKEIAPSVKRAVVIRDPAITAGIGQWSAIQAVASLVGIEVSPVNLRDAGELERDVSAFARTPNSGMILTGSALAVTHRDLIIGLAARHKLPTVYYERYFASAGGLISYGPAFVDQFRQAAGYVDRILKGAKPADLPVQAPTKYETVLNLKTAKALGLDVPTSVLLRADEVIE
jgi:putative tryptophan/tyrosine transport system substrate-binding protein